MKRHLNYGDAPEYEKNINILMEYSEYQTKAYIRETWKLPFVNANPTMQSWIYEDADTDNVVVAWCTTLCRHFLMSTGNSSQYWKALTGPDSIEYFESPEGEGRRPFLAGDPRIYVSVYEIIAQEITN